MAAAGRRRAGVGAQDRVAGVEGEVDAAPDDVDMRLGVRLSREVQAESTVEGERRGHVGHDELDDGRCQPHLGAPV